MAQQQIKDYTHLVTQEGNYVVFSRSGYIEFFPVFPQTAGGHTYTQADTRDCLVTEDLVTGSITTNFRNDNDSVDGSSVIRTFLGTIATDFQMNMYGVQQWSATPGSAYVLDDIVWSDHNCWKAIVTTPNAANVPTLTNADWDIIDSGNILTAFNTHPDEMSNSYAYRPVYSPAQGNIQVLKIANHSFEIRWLGTGSSVSYVAKNYKGGIVEEGNITSNLIEFRPTVDGVYYLEILIDTGVLHYAEVYDFTDTEKCYLDLMKNVLCKCVDCNDCPGPEYDRALNYANTYLLLRDVVYADQSVSVGLTSTEILRTQYINIIGMLIDKLVLMSSNCSCSDSDDINVN